MDIKRADRPSQTEQSSASNGRGRRQKWTGVMKFTSVILLFSVTILLVALLVYVVTGGKKETNEAQYVDTTKYQAVFLVNQQLPYFGKITAMNKDYVVLEDIYYLQIDQTQSVQPGQENNPQNITLVKLGCELHGPQDRMVINSDQLFFWENLKDSDNDSKVAAAIDKFQTSNPNGLECNVTNDTSN